MVWLALARYDEEPVVWLLVADDNSDIDGILLHKLLYLFSSSASHLDAQVTERSVPYSILSEHCSETIIMERHHKLNVNQHYTGD